MNSSGLENMTYESFIRLSFSHSLGRQIDRGEDPAGLAEAGLLDNTGHMPSVKAATIYSVGIFITEIINSGMEINDTERTRLNAYAHRIFDADTYLAILEIIIEFNRTVRDNYYTLDRGILTFINN